MEKEEPIAHVKPNPDGTWEIHTLREHLESVAELAAEFAKPFKNNDWAYLAGLWHDLGKYSREFQAYIKGASGYNPTAHIADQKGKVDHSTAGAIHALKKMGTSGRVLAYTIAGHHAGLADWQNSELGRSQLAERTRQTHLLERVTGASPPERIMNATAPTSRPPEGAPPALWIRMLFSCLVDADFLDTENFMDQSKARARSEHPTLIELAPLLDSHLSEMMNSAEKTLVNKTRAQILEWCKKSAEMPSGLFKLSVPTGGGKTLSSMAFAMKHAILQKKRRIIYVIPYTSIVEQTSNILRGIFGDCVLEHHSNFDPEAETVKSRLACENWDAPIIVTTNVQFFESLFSNRTSRARKLHRIVNSVVVLDEAQLIPSEYLIPILDAINGLSKAFNVTFVLSTATQPALEKRSEHSPFRGLENVIEIIPDPSSIHKRLERVTVEIPRNINFSTTPEALASEISKHETVLCILNRKDECKELYGLMPPGTFHLSGYMCGEHRSSVIAQIKKKLRNKEPLKVISTQLVEAGVDLDFPVVFRALTGLDSLVQAAGRCNREGLLPRGVLKIFVSWKKTPRGHLSHMEFSCREVLHTEPNSLFAPECLDQYFRHLYWMKGTELDKHSIADDLKPDSQLAIKFREAARKFKIIDEACQKSIFVSYGEGQQLIQLLKQRGPDRWILRKLQRFSISIPLYIFQQLYSSGEITEIYPGYFAQEFDGLYHPETGFLGNQNDLIDPEFLVV